MLEQQIEKNQSIDDEHPIVIAVINLLLGSERPSGDDTILEKPN